MENILYGLETWIWNVVYNQLKRSSCVNEGLIYVNNTLHIQFEQFGNINGLYCITHQSIY